MKVYTVKCVVASRVVIHVYYVQHVGCIHILLHAMAV